MSFLELYLIISCGALTALVISNLAVFTLRAILRRKYEREIVDNIKEAFAELEDNEEYVLMADLDDECVASVPVKKKGKKDPIH